MYFVTCWGLIRDEGIMFEVGVIDQEGNYLETGTARQCDFLFSFPRVNPSNEATTEFMGILWKCEKEVVMKMGRKSRSNRNLKVKI